METRFLLPVTIAATLHVSVLFGARWPKHAAPVKPAIVAAQPSPTIAIVSEPEEIVADPNETQRAPKGSPDTTPRSDDTIRPDSVGFEQVVVPYTASIPTPTSFLPTDVIGVPEGDANSSLSHAPGIFSTIALDNPPKTRSQVPPVYPAEAKNDKSGAEVLVEFVVDESGRVLSPRVVRSSDRRFESSTLKAVARWRFEPGRVQGKAVRFRMMAPVVFSLDA